MISSWKIKIGYSVTIEIEAPEGTQIREINYKNGGQHFSVDFSTSEDFVELPF